MDIILIFLIYKFVYPIDSSLYAQSLQLCLRLCDPMDYNLPGSSPWDSPGKNTGVGCHFLLQGIFQTQGLNPHLLCLLYGWVGSLPLMVIPFFSFFISPGEGNGNPLPVFLPGKSQGQRSLAGHNSWGHRRVEPDLVTKPQFSISQQRILKNKRENQVSGTNTL